MWKKFFSRPAPAPEPPQTLKQRVRAFWHWYSGAAEGLYAAIEEKRCGDLEPLVSPKVDEFLPGMAWVFGPGENDVGHSFTLTPEGDPHQRLVAQYWLQNAPQLEGWTFYASRQPSKLGGHSIRINDTDFSAEEIWITPFVDEQEECVDLTVWHPLFGTIEQRLRWTVTSLWLDEALGEDLVSQRIGEVKLGDDQLAGSMPLSELPDFIAQLEQENGWKRFIPYLCYSAYRYDEPELEAGLRKDIFAGTTLQMRIVHDYPMDSNPLADFGAAYEMIVIPIDMLPSGRQVDVRGELEETLNAALESEGAGKVLGGASGLENAYIDFVIFDGARSRHLVNSVMAATPFAERYSIANFVSEG